MIKLLYIVLLIVCAVGCAPKQEKKFFTRLHRDGIRETGYLTKDSALVGDHEYYYPNDTLQCKEFYINGRLNGRRSTYYSDGKIEQTCEFQDGLEEGWCLNFDSNGSLTAKVYFLHGKEMGDHYFYYPDGTVKQYVLLNFSHVAEKDILYYPDGSFADSTGGAVFIDTVYNNTPTSDKLDSVYVGLLLSHPPRCRTSLKITEEDSLSQVFTTSYPDSSLSYIYFVKKIDHRLKLMKIVADQYDSTVNHTRVYSTIIEF